MFVKPHPEKRIVLGHESDVSIDVPIDVLHPHTRQPIPRDGIDVPDHDAYWVRRLRDGDVVLADRPAPVSEAGAPAPEPDRVEEHPQ